MKRPPPALVPALFAALAVGAGLLLLRWLPAPGSTAAQLCRESPTPRLCRAMERLAGAPASPPDLAAAADLATPPDLAQSPPLVAGVEALRQGWHATAYRRCEEAAAHETGEPTRRAALLCQGRAALGLGWPARAAYTAQRALDLAEDAEGHVLLGDAHEAQGDCRQARPAFLRALELSPGLPAAKEGLRRCQVDPQPPRLPDLTLRAGQGGAYSSTSLIVCNRQSRSLTASG